MEDSDPKRVAAIVNMLVEVLIDHNTEISGYDLTEENITKMIDQVESQISNLQSQYKQISDEKIQSQLKQINDQITYVQDEIEKLTAEISALDSQTSLNTISKSQSSQLSEKQAQLAQFQSLLVQLQQIRINLEIVGNPALNSSDLGGDTRLQLVQSTLDHYQKTYLELLDNLQAVQLAKLRNLPTVDQIEKAVAPLQPVRPQLSINIILGCIVGLLFAVGMIFIFEYLDDTLKTPEVAQQVLAAPVLGNITYKQITTKEEKELPFDWEIYSQTSEAINILRINLDLTIANSPLKTLCLLNINESGKGKTNIAADLAISYAKSGSRVVLVDADLWNPSIHSYFGLDNKNGFGDLLADDTKTKAAGKNVEGIFGLTIITGGNVYPETIVSLNPDNIIPILKILKEQSDMVIIDAPSISDVGSRVMASLVDGVLIVIQPKVTTKSYAIQSMKQLNLAGAKIIGIVVYRIPHNFANYFRSFKYRIFKFLRINSSKEDLYV